MGRSPDVFAVCVASSNTGSAAAPSQIATPSETSNDRIRWGRVILVAVAGVVSHTFGRATIAILLPAMVDDLELSVTTAGAIGTVNFGAYLAGVVTVTFIAGSVEPFTLLRAGVAISATGLAVLGIATTTDIVLIGTGLAGFGGAGIWLTAPLIATDGIPVHRRGLAMGVLTATMGAALVMIPFATSGLRILIADAAAWRPIWMGEFAVSVLLLALISLIVKVPRTERLSAIGGMAALRGIGGWKRTVAAYMAFAYVTASFTQFLGLALERDHGFSRQAATLSLSLLGAGSLVGAVVFGRISDRLGRPATMSFVMAAVAVSAAAVGFGNASVALAAVCAFGATSFAYPALTATFVRDHVSDRTFAAVFGTMTIFYGPASATGPSVGGWLADRTSEFTATYAAMAAISMLGAICMMTMSRRSGETRLALG